MRLKKAPTWLGPFDLSCASYSHRRVRHYLAIELRCGNRLHPDLQHLACEVGVNGKPFSAVEEDSAFQAGHALTFAEDLTQLVEWNVGVESRLNDLAKSEWVHEDEVFATSWPTVTHASAPRNS